MEEKPKKKLLSIPEKKARSLKKSKKEYFAKLKRESIQNEEEQFKKKIKTKTARELFDHSLNLNERKFVEEYLIDLNIRRAYEASGIKVHRARIYDIIDKPKIKRMINLRREEIQKELAVDQGRMVKEYLNIAYSRMSSYYDIDEKGYSKFKIWDDLTEEQKAAVAEVAFGTDKEGNRFITRIKLFDKMRALEGIAKHLGFFEKDNKQKADITITIDNLLDELDPDLANGIRKNLMNSYSEEEADGIGLQIPTEGQETVH